MNQEATSAQTNAVLSETEMSSIQALFARAANTLIEHTKLNQDVIELRQSVEAMKAEVEKLRSSNAWMDDQITSLRKQRDEANEAAAHAQRERDEAKIELEETRRKLEQATAYNDNQRLTLDQVRHDYNDAMRGWDEAESRAKAAEAKVAKLRAALGLDDPPAGHHDPVKHDPEPSQGFQGLPASGHSEPEQPKAQADRW